MDQSPRVSVRGLLVAAFLISGSVSAAEPLQQDLSVSLEPGETRRYDQPLAEGEFLRVQIEQLGADVEVRVLDPAGREVWYGDAKPSGSETESAFWVAATGGLHALTVTSKSKQKGDIRIALVECRTASEADRALAKAESHLRVAELKRREKGAAALTQCVKEAEAAQALLPRDHERQRAALSFLGLCHRDLDHHDQARAAFLEAAALSRAAGDGPSEAQALVYLGNLHWARGEFREAVVLQEQAAELYGRSGRKSGEGYARGNAATLYAELGQTERAVRSFEAAIACFREAVEPGGEALARMNLGTLLQREGRADAALATLEEALLGLRQAGNRTAEAAALNTMGAVFGDLGDHARARSYAEQALVIRRELGNRRAQGRSESNIGEAYLEEGDLAQARTHVLAALELFRQAKDKDGEAWSLYLLGRVSRAQGAADARTHWEEALRLRRETGAVQEEGWLLATLAEEQIERGQPARARGLLDDSLVRFQAAADPHGEAHVSYLRARVERALGNRAAALEHAEKALSIVDSVRARVASTELRATYLAKVRRYYELQLELLLETESGPPAAAAKERAFAVSERARARALLDLFAISAAELDADLDPELRRRRQDLQDEIASRQVELASSAASSRERGELARQEAMKSLDRAYEAYDLLAQEIRRRHPSYGTLAYPEPAGLSEAQRLLQPQEALLEYFVGESASYLFLVDATGLEVYRLPAAPTIVKSVAELRAGLAKPSQLGFSRLARAAHELYRSLVQPAEQRLRGRRHLLIAPDGPLYRVPFEVLLTGPARAAHTSPSMPYLLRRFDVRYVPAVGVAHRLPAEGTKGALDLFAVGDPGAPGKTVASARSLTQRSLFGDRDEQAPLPGARDEVTAIAGLFPRARVLTLLGEAATEAGVKKAALREARYLHFATHGLVSERRPAESGLLLAPASDGQDGFLQVHEILRLELGPGLVTLSACSTGLGREVLGEGLLGLTQAFFAAGARGVVATLWPVTDVSSSDLMAGFYRGLARGEADANALRAAKLALLRGGRWSHPHHWAPYVLIGR